MSFKFIELFAGIGGFRIALDRLGGKCVFASENDKFARQSYKAIYGDEPSGDITQIYAKDIPDHDVLTGGFPCQAFSVAGYRKGFDDTRGTLFFEIARIAAEKKPRLMLLENVKGLVSHDKGRTLDVMIQTLHDIGYAVDFRVLNSKYFGVPQNRERIFIVCDRDAQHEPWNITEKGVVGKAKKRVQALGIRTFNFDWPEEGDVTKRLRDVLETNVEDKYYLSEDKTEKLIDKLLIEDQSNQDEPIMVGHADIKGHDSIKRVYGVGGVCPTLTTMGGGHREPKIAEPLQFSDGSGISYNLDANYTKGTAPGDVGKGRRTHVVEEVRPVLTPDRDRHGVAIGAYPQYHIRKLTPLECWRLQGFPDSAHESAKQAGVSDSQRYKQAGNAVTVNVIEAIGERLFALIDKRKEKAS